MEKGGARPGAGWGAGVFLSSCQAIALGEAWRGVLRAKRTELAPPANEEGGAFPRGEFNRGRLANFPTRDRGRSRVIYEPLSCGGSRAKATAVCDSRYMVRRNALLKSTSPEDQSGAARALRLGAVRVEGKRVVPYYFGARKIARGARPFRPEKEILGGRDRSKAFFLSRSRLRKVQARGRRRPAAPRLRGPETATLSVDAGPTSSSGGRTFKRSTKLLDVGDQVVGGGESEASPEGSC